MSDLLILNLDPDVRRSLEQRARAHDRDVADEARELLRGALGVSGARPNVTGRRRGWEWGRG